MDGLVKVAIDAMGGDNAPLELVKGTVEAVNSSEKLKCFLVGKEDVIKKELASYEYDKNRIAIVNADDVITKFGLFESNVIFLNKIMLYKCKSTHIQSK